MTQICVGNLTTIGSDNGLSPGRRQAIIWTNAGILLIGHPGTNLGEILIEIHTFSFKIIHLKMSSGKWRPSCLGLNVLRNRHGRKSYKGCFRPNRLPCWMKSCHPGKRTRQHIYMCYQLLRRNIRGMNIDKIQLNKRLRRDSVHKQILATKRKLEDKDGFDSEEAMRYAVCRSETKVSHTKRKLEDKDGFDSEEAMRYAGCRSETKVSHTRCWVILAVMLDWTSLIIVIQWNLFVKTTSIIEFITCDLFSNVSWWWLKVLIYSC